MERNGVVLVVYAAPASASSIFWFKSILFLSAVDQRYSYLLHCSVQMPKWSSYIEPS
jgi:hypothetical protein